MGGWVALQMAARFPRAVSRLLLLASAGTNFEPAYDRTLFTPRNPAELQRLLNKLMPKAPRMPVFLARDMLRSMGSRGWVMERAASSMFGGQDVMDEQIAGLKMPTLILWGEQDEIIPLQAGRFLQSRIRGSQLKTFDGCGHLLVELCAPRVIPAMVDFLQARGDAASSAGGDDDLASDCGGN